MAKSTKKSSKKSASRILYVGIDLSFSATGICVSNKKFDRVSTGIISSRKDDSLFDRVRYISQEIRNYIASQVVKGTKIKCIAIEQLAYGSRSHRQLQIAYLHYRVRVDLMEWYVKEFKADCPLYVVPPSTLKKFVTGKGNCKKNVMLKCCYQNWEFDTNDDNICDAYCVCRYAVTKKLFKTPPTLERVM